MQYATAVEAQTPEQERRATLNRAVKLTFRWPIEQQGDKQAMMFVPLVTNGQPIVTLAHVEGVSQAEHDNLAEQLTDLALSKLAIV